MAFLPVWDEWTLIFSTSGLFTFGPFRNGDILTCNRLHRTHAIRCKNACISLKICQVPRQPRYLPNFRVIAKLISCFWDFTRSYGKTSFAILNQSSGSLGTKLPIFGQYRRTGKTKWVQELFLLALHYIMMCCDILCKQSCWFRCHSFEFLNLFR